MSKAETAELEVPAKQLVQAVPFNPFDPIKFTYIVDKCCEHRPWFNDFTWADEMVKRMHVISYLQLGKVWEVWYGKEMLGLLLLNNIIEGIDAQAHFIFFDHKLSNKRKLCQRMLQKCFDDYDLQVIRIEIPQYAANLIGFCRKALGFKYEAEWRGVSTADAKRACRRITATKYEGAWNDVFLLSLTRDGYREFVGASHERS